MRPSLSKKTEKILYWIIISILLAGSGMLMILKLTGISFQLPMCTMLKWTGFYCPGCGGTRAFFLLLKGHLAASFYYHPIVMYAVGVTGWYIISHSIEYLSKEKYAIGMRYRDIYLYGALALILINWIIKNMFWIVAGIRLI